MQILTSLIYIYIYIYILVWSEKTKFGVSKKNYDRKLPNGRYPKTHEKLFKNISVFHPYYRAKISKNTILSRKRLVFMLLFFISSYLPALACTVGKNSLN